MASTVVVTVSSGHIYWHKGTLTPNKTRRSGTLSSASTSSRFGNYVGGHMVLVTNVFGTNPTVCCFTTLGGQTPVQRYGRTSPLRLQYAAVGKTDAVNDYPVIKTTIDQYLSQDRQYIRIQGPTTVDLENLVPVVLATYKATPSESPSLQTNSYDDFKSLFLELNTPTFPAVKIATITDAGGDETEDTADEADGGSKDGKSNKRPRPERPKGGGKRQKSASHFPALGARTASHTMAAGDLGEIQLEGEDEPLQLQVEGVRYLLLKEWQALQNCHQVELTEDQEIPVDTQYVLCRLYQWRQSVET